MASYKVQFRSSFEQVSAASHWKKNQGSTWELILEVLGQERRGAVSEGAPPISRTQSGLARELERIRSFPLLLDQNLEPTVAHAEISEPSRNPLE